MPNGEHAFANARGAARRAVEAAAEARATASAANDRLVRAKLAVGAARRTGDQSRVEAAEQSLAAAEEELAERRRLVDAAVREERAALDAFVELADPRRQIGQLPDDVPLLLLPVRLETRFLDGDLLVRVYPDTCAVDGFEPRLSDVEVESASRYWAQVWAGAGTREARLAAWRGVVRSHGSGRAAWIVQQHPPDNPGDAPTEAGGADVVLVVTTTDPAQPPDRPRAAAYWEAVWRAAGDTAAVAAAEQALDADLGMADADAVRARPPFNLSAAPPAGTTHSDAAVTVAFLELPSANDVETRRSSWTQAPRAHLLPDRFVLLGYTGGTQVVAEVGAAVPATLAVGPDPSAAADEQLQIVDGELVIPPELRWMVDFDDAVERGMAFRVPLTGATAGGLDRLLVVGVRLRADAGESAADLATLITHHLHSRDGFGLVPQGTPTNNTEKLEAGSDRHDDPDRSFVDWFERPDLAAAGADPDHKLDGQWLAEYLGIDVTVLQHAGHADATDQREARAANVALWPATWGYFLETMMAPVLDPGTVDATRDFFVEFVSGRGAVPAVRVGTQPYGILPTTVLSRLSFGRPGPVIEGPARVPFLDRLGAVLGVMAGDWAALAATVSHVGSQSDPHQTLLDILGLHAASVEHHQRYAESVEDLWNRTNLRGFGGAFLASLIALGLERRGMELLEGLGYDGADGPPDILKRLFLDRQHELRGPLIDDRPLSESDPVRAYTDDGRNYLAWLRDAGGTSLDLLRRQEGFSDDTPPTALLYLLLRHALLLSWWDTSVRLRLDADVLDGAAVRQLRHETPFVHVADEAPPVESRWQQLYSPEVAVTDRDDVLIADYIPTVLGEAGATRHLADVISAVDRLAGVPTARLERVLVEHLDSTTYRLDAWRLGLVRARLHELRYGGREEAEGPHPGVHVGAYGWLEDVRPEARELFPVDDLDDELTAVFEPAGGDGLRPLVRDSANGGHVQAPSLNHAATAAILRAGYLADASSANPGTLAVNLSSNRVRAARTILEGIRNGQPLKALLGYQFERGLHDRHGLAEVDKFIYPLRKRFPLNADQLSDTATGDDVPVEEVEARNVIDGLALARHAEPTGRRSYPFGLAGLPPATEPERAAIDAEVERLIDATDAVADLALAEGVHQAVLGNTDRVAATLDAYSKGGFPPEPAVASTPRSGTTLLHRVALHLPAGAAATTSPVTGVAMTPRAQGEPAVNAWLASLLPLPADVACRAVWTDSATRTTQEVVVTQAELGLQPLDLLYVLRLPDQAAMAELDDRIIGHVRDSAAPRPDAAVEIRYTERVAGKITFFELAPLVERLRALVLRSRPLQPTDVALHSEATGAEDEAVSADPSRVALVRATLDGLRTTLTAFVGDLDPLVADPAANRTALVAGIDTFVDRLASALATAARHGVPQAGWGSLLEWRRTQYAELLSAVAEVVARWRVELGRADDLIAVHDALPGTASDEERFTLLQQAERHLTTTPTSPRPAHPAELRTIVGTARAAFVARLTGLEAVATTTAATLPALLAEVRSLLPLSAFDPVGLDMTPFEDRIVAYAADLLARAVSVRDEVDHRLATADARVVEHGSAAGARAKVDALVAATKALLGDDMVLVPTFQVSSERAAEWQQALTASTSGPLLSHLAGRDFPVDDWLSGLARVREKLSDWERLVLLAGAIGRSQPELLPVQLPHRPDDRWLGLEFPAGTALDGDRLLYTAHYPQALTATDPQCGLLLDEWTEVLPAPSETTGLAFHYDTPNSEPPNAMLLVVPPVRTGAWRWEDVVDALHETLDLAKTRLVEPAQIDGTAYAQFLPATVTAATAREVSISVNFAVNNAAVFLEQP